MPATATTSGVPQGTWRAAAAKANKEGLRRTMFTVKRTQTTGLAALSASGPVQEYTFAGSYQGAWHDNKRHGFGIEVCTDGTKYEGEWQNNKRHGKGTLFKYKVPLGRDGQAPRGARAVYLKVYVGEWGEGNPHGKGVMIYDNGDEYDGEFVGGLREGQGVMRYKDGSRYTGEWARGKAHGAGSLVLPNGDSYTGGWSDGLKHGPGRFVYAAKRTIYIGEWALDQARCGEMRALTAADVNTSVAGAIAAGVAPEREDDLPLPQLGLVEPAAVVQRSLRQTRAEVASALRQATETKLGITTAASSVPSTSSSAARGPAGVAASGRGGATSGYGAGSTAQLFSSGSLLDDPAYVAAAAAAAGGDGAHGSTAGGFGASLGYSLSASTAAVDPWHVDYHSGLSSDEIGQLRQAFAVADVDLTGYITADVDSVGAILTALGIQAGLDDVLPLCKQLAESQHAADDDLAVQGGATETAVALAATHRATAADAAAALAHHTPSFEEGDGEEEGGPPPFAQATAVDVSFATFAKVMARLKD